MIMRDNFCEFCINKMLDPSSELSRFDEGSQHMVSMRNKKNYPQLSSNTPSYDRALDKREYLMIIRDNFY